MEKFLAKDFLERVQKDKFAEDLLVAWAFIEQRADESILKAYSLSSQDVRAEPLLRFNIDKKFQLFRDMKVLSKTDYKLLQKMEIKRNRLFHSGGIFIPNMTDNEKKEITVMTVQSMEIIYKISELLGQRQGERRIYQH
ncbi:MAG TPA: hypothetical protein VK536_04600 [Candidatus Limnocylindrales bacterium]|nr:hypothetical protein [Candidatus Limnocylindrales bacterium]